MDGEERKLTYGEKAVGINFNHGEGEIHDHIESAKSLMAQAIDMMHEIEMQSGNQLTGYPLGYSQERADLCHDAIRALQRASMDMVKSITWKD